MSNQWIKLPPRANCSNVQHFVLFWIAMWLYPLLPAWAFLSIAVVVIELDQAITHYGTLWWVWFKMWDTWYDMMAGYLAIIIIEIFKTF